MRGLLKLWFGLMIAAGAVVAEPSPARPFLSPLFGNDMVIQRDKPCRVWGWTAPAAHVQVTLGEVSAAAIAQADGRWQVSLTPPPAGGPYHLEVAGPERRTLDNILVGDVWICSGQSNMELPLKATDGGAAEALRADEPSLRLLTVHSRTAYAPADQLAGTWKRCEPASAGDFSAVAYYFGRKLVQTTHVPIGLVEDCLGGSPAEAWMSRAALDSLGEFSTQTAAIAELHAQGGPEYGSFLMHWLDRFDRGGVHEAWAQRDFDDRSWTAVSVPGGFRELGVPTDPAVVWFRREIELASPAQRTKVKISLGEVERMDTVYVNGHWVGASSWVENPRLYAVPNGFLVPGRNVIAVRVFKTKPNGGFRSEPAALHLEFADGTRLALAGLWKAALSFDARPPQPLPLDLENYPTMPTVLFNGMIAPLAPLAMAGAIWYQGEANTARPAGQYRKLLPALIADWRKTFGQGDFPFYIVSLPAFTARKREPGGGDGWAELRAVQSETARSVPNAGVALTLDTGNPANIHPTEKRPVGERLALCALAGYYHFPVEAEGPRLNRIERQPGGLSLQFDHVGAGLTVHGGQLGEFSVAGPDGRWQWAEAKLAGPATVTVSSPAIADPVSVRYAWQANPLATLFNSEGLPAEPFDRSLAN